MGDKRKWLAQLWSIAISLAIVSLGASLCGCATIDITVAYDASANIANLKSYSWTIDSKQSTGEPLLDDPSLHAVIQSAIDEELGGKNYQKESSDGDFLLHYSALLEGKEEIITQEEYEDYPLVYGWNMGYVSHERLEDGTQTYIREYQEGTLIIDILEPKTDRLIWRGSATADIQRTASLAKRRDRAQKAVRDILESLPAATR